MKTPENYYFTSLRISITWLEKYIEIANYYSDWKLRKQTDDAWIIRKDSKATARRAIGTSLMVGFAAMLDEESLEFREKLKNEFYQWLDTSQIKADHTPTELKCALFHFHEILECRFEKAQKDQANRQREIEIDSPEYLEKMEKVFSKSQQAIHSGKVKEMDDSKFNGDPVVGKATFVVLANSLSTANKENFSFWPQKANNNGKQTSSPNSTQDPKKPLNPNSQNTKNQELSPNYPNYIVIGIGILLVVAGGIIAIFLSKNKTSANN